MTRPPFERIGAPFAIEREVEAVGVAHPWLGSTVGAIRAELTRIGFADWGVRVGESWAEVSSPDDACDPSDVEKIVKNFNPAWHNLEAVYSPGDEDEISVAVNLFWTAQ